MSEGSYSLATTEQVATINAIYQTAAQFDVDLEFVFFMGTFPRVHGFVGTREKIMLFLKAFESKFGGDLYLQYFK